MEGRNVGTIGWKSPEQDLTSAKDLPIEYQSVITYSFDEINFLRESLISR